MPASNVAPAPMPSNQSNMVAYESNGMTYYIDPSQMYSSAPQMEGYPQQAVPGMGGMMTPSPEGAQYYYPQQMQPGAVFYPTQ